MSERKKQELKEYQKRRYREAKESKNNEQNISLITIMIQQYTIKSIYLEKLTEIKA